MGPPYLDVAVRGDERQTALRHLVSQEAEQQQRCWIGPVYVIEHDEQRAAGRGVLEEPRDAVEQAEARRVPFDPWWRGQIGQTLSDGRNHLRDVGSSRSKVGQQLGGRTSGDVRPSRLRPRPIWRRPAAFVTAAPEHLKAAFPSVEGDLLRGPRLADARLAGEEKKPPAARARLLDPGTQHCELRLA